MQKRQVRFPRIMRTLRVWFGVTQAELGARTGIDQRIISSIENELCAATPEQEKLIKARLSWNEYTELAFEIVQGDLITEESIIEAVRAV